MSSKIGQIFNAVPIIGINRHRLLTDGNGITTLVAFHGCLLQCAYCINPQCKTAEGIQRWLTPDSLYSELKRDDLYFRSTGGGICFGGGEPLIRTYFIKEFKNFCGDNWRIILETSLNVPQENVEDIVDIIDEYIVDIKDMSGLIYKRYTGCDNNQVIDNLHFLINRGKADKIHIRVPYIPGYNTKQDIDHSLNILSSMGLNHIECFSYITDVNSKEKVIIDDSRMPLGKAICEVLKKVRLTIAEANSIEYQPAICNHKENCLGTCPRCEQELRELSENLWRRESMGQKINI